MSGRRRPVRRTGGGEHMKYVLLFCAEGDAIDRFSRMTPEELAAQEKRVGEWFAEHGSRITGGKRLAPPQSATPARFHGSGQPLGTGGPFLEGNEGIGGVRAVGVAAP